MPDTSDTPILHHPLDEPSAFTAKNLIESVRRARHIPNGLVPSLCVLEFDGDLTDWLVGQGLAKPFQSWPCFHTTMFAIEAEGVTCGIIPRTIGGPYAVLVARSVGGCHATRRVLPRPPQMVTGRHAANNDRTVAQGRAGF